MSTMDPQLLLSFISRVLECPGFEIHILPKFLGFCKTSVITVELTEQSRSILKLLAKLIIVKSSPCHSGIELPSWKSYQLDFGADSVLLELILNQLNKRESYEELVASLIILPHVKHSQVQSVLPQLIAKLCQESAQESESNENLFALSLAVEAAVHCNIGLEEMLEPLVSTCLRNNPQLAALRILDLVVTVRAREDAELYQKLTAAHLHHNLSSPYHKVISNVSLLCLFINV
jgi:hypothetical protein